MDSKLRPIDSVRTQISSAAALSWVNQHIWLNDYSLGELCQIMVETGEIINSLQCAGVISGLAWDGHNLWQTRMDEDWIQRVNPETLDFDLTLPIAGASRLSDVTWDGSQLWVNSQTMGELVAIDLEAGEALRTLKIPVATTALDYHENHFWISYPDEMEYDPISDGFSWVGDEKNFILAQIDPKNGRILSRYQLNFLPAGLAWHEKRLWLSNSTNGTIAICEITK